MSALSIYVLRAKGTDRVKIGRSRDVAKRVKQLQAASPHELEIAGVVTYRDEVGLESKLHRHFAESRESGEWFRADPVEVLVVAEEIVRAYRPSVPLRPPAPSVAFKEWTPEQLLDLVKLAKRKGIGRKRLAEEYIGFKDESYLSHMLKGRKVPSDVTRNAMMRAEERIKRLKDKE